MLKPLACSATPWLLFEALSPPSPTPSPPPPPLTLIVLVVVVLVHNHVAVALLVVLILILKLNSHANLPESVREEGWALHLLLDLGGETCSALGRRQRIGSM